MQLLFSELRKSRHFFSIALDIFMLTILALDLMWLAFDALFEVEYIQDIFISYFTNFGLYYRDVVHPNFLFFDGFVVLIFTTELLLRWAVAIYRKTHYRWFFYPIAHWYDVLGIIPNGSFRILRLFRVFSMLYKLYNWGFLDLKNNIIVKTFLHYYSILVEEVSDRVAVKLLRELQSELQKGEPLIDKLIEKAFIPRKALFVNYVASAVQNQLRQQYEIHREPIRAYIQKTVANSVYNNKEVANLQNVPLLGNYMRHTLQESVSEIVFAVFDKLLQDFSYSKAEPALLGIVQGIFDIALEPAKTETGDSLASNIVNDCIDIIIERVSVQQWKKNISDKNE